MPSQFITVQFGHLRTSGLYVIFYPCREGSWRSAFKKPANDGLILSDDALLELAKTVRVLINRVQTRVCSSWSISLYVALALRPLSRSAIQGVLDLSPSILLRLRF